MKPKSKQDQFGTELTKLEKAWENPLYYMAQRNPKSNEPVAIPADLLKTNSHEAYRWLWKKFQSLLEDQASFSFNLGQFDQKIIHTIVTKFTYIMTLKYFL